MNNIKNLIEIFQSYLDNIGDEHEYENLIKTMHSKQMSELLDSFIEKSEKDDDLEKDEIELLRIIIKVCNSIYNYSGDETGLTDSQYDELFEYYKNQSGKDDIITESIKGNKDVEYHSYKTLRGTLDKIYKITEEDVLKNKSQKSLEIWVKQMERRYLEKTGIPIDLYEEDVIEMPKFDGVSCIFEYDENNILVRALTRGDTSTNEAQNVTHIVSRQSCPKLKDNNGKPYGIKTEIMMLDNDLDKYNELNGTKYKNTRSIVSSILNSDEADDRVNYLVIVPLRYSFLDNDGTESRQYLCDEVFNYPYIKCKLKDLDKLHDFAFSHKTVYPGLRCDGSVIQLVNQHVQDVLGRENEKQKYEVAFKFTEEIAYSEIIDVEFSAGLFGKISPVAIFKPVKMKRNTISRASLGSYSRFKDLLLSKGDKIKIMYDIIPYVTFDDSDPKCIRSKKSLIDAPLVCAECGKSLEVSDTGDTLFCNNKKCPCRIKGQILNYCNKMNIANISYATIDDLYKEGYLNGIEDLYTLKYHAKDITCMKGYGINKINNIIEEIDNHKNVSESTLFGSIGIEGVSIKTFKNIFSYINIDDLITYANEKNYDFFTVIPGIKDITAKKIVDGINNNIKLIEILLKEIEVYHDKRQQYRFKVVFTKISSVDEQAKEEFLNIHGGVNQEDITKDVDLLIVPNLSVESGKVTKAKKYGIPIVSYDEMEDYILKNII